MPRGTIADVMSPETPRILLVDNDERIVELVAWFLRERGLAVTTALSFAAARPLLAEGRPALMLADIELGEESGREELPKLAGEGLLPPTLVVSGYLDPVLEAELRALQPVLGTLAKPYDLPVLLERVLEALELAPGVAAATVARPERGDGAAQEEPVEDEDGWIEIVPVSRSGGEPRDPGDTTTPNEQPALRPH